MLEKNISRCLCKKTQKANLFYWDQQLFTVTTSDRFISQYFPLIFPLLQARIFLSFSMMWDVSATNRLETYISFPQPVSHLRNLISCLLASYWKTAQMPSHLLQKRCLRTQWCFSRLIRASGFGKASFSLQKFPPTENGLLFHMFCRGALRDTDKIIWRFS